MKRNREIVDILHHQREISLRWRSWSPYFRKRSAHRKWISRMAETSPHAAFEWAEIFKLTELKDFISTKITNHAPWLNAEAISHRMGMNRTRVNGYFIK